MARVKLTYWIYKDIATTGGSNLTDLHGALLNPIISYVFTYILYRMRVDLRGPHAAGAQRA